MTADAIPAAPPPRPHWTTPEELERFLADYQPEGVPVAAWRPIAAPAAALVLSAGKPTRLRVEKDIQLLGAVVAHLIERGRPVTLDEALSDTTLLDFDTSLRASAKTRENKRGIHRRLQAAHRGLPWRTERRADGGRVKNLVPYTQLGDLHRVERTARATGAAHPDAEAFVAALAAHRAHRAGDSSVPPVDAATWSRARAYAARHGLALVQTALRALVTHELLARVEPVAVLVRSHALTRRDLDLALTQVVRPAPGSGREGSTASARHTLTPGAKLARRTQNQSGCARHCTTVGRRHRSLQIPRHGRVAG